jgi:hypothetical protein
MPILKLSKHSAWTKAVAVLTYGLAAGWYGSVQAAEHVIHISVDGLNAAMLQSAIDAGTTPTFRRLQVEGAATMNARTDFAYTVTLPNHATMISGRPVSAVEGMPDTTHHGYTRNDSPTVDETLHNSGNPALDYLASVFDVVHDAGYSTALYASKSKFKLFDQSYDGDTGAVHPNGRDKIDRFFVAGDTAAPYAATMQAKFLAEMPVNRFNYTFIHYADLDRTGHTSGWGSAEWNASLANVDAYLAGILELVEADAQLATRTTVIVTADHGGLGTSHGDPTLPAEFTIPLFAWGVGASPGDLYELNTGVRTDPLDTRPSYAAAAQPIRNGDTGNLALDLLGLGPIPGSLINAAQDLRVAMPGDYNGDAAIDAVDYTMWRNTLGDSGFSPPADGDGDNEVDADDYAVWKAHYGDTASLGSGGLTPARQAASLPEPSHLTLAIVALLFGMTGRVSRSK